MKFEDIISKDESRADFALYGQRFSFHAEDQCRIYRFEKKLGVNLSLYCDHFDEELYSHLNVPFNDQDILDNGKTGTYILVQVRALNVETGDYEDIELRGGNLLPFQSKKTSKTEMILAPEHINDESQYRISIRYRFVELAEKRVGFLLKRTVISGKCTPNEEVELTGTLVSQRQPQGYQSPNESFDEFEEGIEF